jgi:hypothetical protein
MRDGAKEYFFIQDTVSSTEALDMLRKLQCFAKKNNPEIFFYIFIYIKSRGPLPREHLFITIKYKIPGASGREAEIQPELQNGEVVKSRHA